MLWKGRTFNQIISKIKLNKGIIEGTNKFISSPIKQYRREIDTEDNCTRATTTMMDFFRPGATIVNSASGAGIHTLDIVIPNDLCETPIENSCSARAENAKRRVRSGKNPDTKLYCTSSIQRLEKRGLQYEQHNYRNLQTGDPTFNTGTPATLQNVYVQNVKNRSPRVRIFMNGMPLFKYRWINGQEYDVVIPNGEYNLEELNGAFNNIMAINKHYLIDLHANIVKIYFMKFVYDTHQNRIQIQCSGIDSQMFPSTRYETWTSYLIKVDWNLPEHTLIPNIILLPKTEHNSFLDIIGFESPGYYPPEKISETEPFTQPDTILDPANNYYIGKPRYYVMGEKEPQIKTKFEPLIYKPSNTKFGVQGAVTSSSVIARLRYNTITGATTQYTTPLGQPMAIPLAYNIPAPGYSHKYSVGYSAGCIPTILTSKNSVMSFCPDLKTKGG